LPHPFNYLDNRPGKYYSYKTFIHFDISEKRVLWNNQRAARIRVA